MVSSFTQVNVISFNSVYEEDLCWLSSHNFDLSSKKKGLYYGSLVFISEDEYRNHLAIGMIMQNMIMCNPMDFIYKNLKNKEFKFFYLKNRKEY